MAGRVLHVIETLGRGGAERLLVTLLPALRAQGVEAAVAVLRPPYDLQPEIEAAGVPVIRLEQRRKWRLLQMARAIAVAARQQNADLVQAHLYFPGLGVALMRLLRQSPARTLMSFHNLAYAGANRGGTKLRLRRGLARGCLSRGMDGYVAVSDAVAEHFADALGLPRPEVIPNPLDPAVRQIRPEPLTRDLRSIVVPGRLVPEKGHEDLLAALQRVGLPEGAEVIFAGGGPLDERLRAAAAAFGGRVRLTGWLSHADLLQEVARADLVVLPSRHEGFGIAAIEALALGRPMISTTAGGLPQAVGDAARLVPPQDPGALATALQSLLDEPKARLALAALGPDQAAQFEAGAIAARYIALYNKISARGPK